MVVLTHRGGSMKKSYLVRDFREESGRLRVAEIAFIPVFHLVWQMAEDTLSTDQFSSLSDPIFRGHEGHFKKGRWKCFSDSSEVFITPYYTDLNINIASESIIHMAHRIEVEGMVSGAVEKAFSAIAFFFRKHAADKALFHLLHKNGTQAFAQYCSDVLPSDVCRFYNLG